MTKGSTADPGKKQHPCCRDPVKLISTREYVGVKLVLAGTPVTVFNFYSPPDKQIQLHNIKVEPRSWIITGDFNSHSPSWAMGSSTAKKKK